MDCVFKDIPLFKDLSTEVLEILQPVFEPCTCYKGVIFEQGDPAIHLYILTQGAVDILYKPYDAPVITVTTLKPWEIFGWSAITGNTVYTSGAACNIECQAMRVRGSDLRNLSIEHPQAGEILLDRLAESVSMRWQDAHSQVRDILSQGVAKN